MPLEFDIAEKYKKCLNIFLTASTEMKVLYLSLIRALKLRVPELFGDDKIVFLKDSAPSHKDGLQKNFYSYCSFFLNNTSPSLNPEDLSKRIV